MPELLKTEEQKIEASLKIADAVMRAWYQAPPSFRRSVETAAGEIAEMQGESKSQGEVNMSIYTMELGRSQDEVYLEKVDKQRRYNAEHERLSQAQQDIRRRLLNS